jgi:hypothetical protein
VKNVVSKKPRKNSPKKFWFEPVWKGKNRTELKLISLNRFLIRFGSKTKKKNKFGLVVYFGPKPDRTENAQPYAYIFAKEGNLKYGQTYTFSPIS